MTDKVEKSDAAWRAELSREQFNVLRLHGTERAFSHRGFPSGPGRFHCAGCGAALFSSAARFESGTGWPSFTAPIDADAVEERADYSYGMRRVEVVCARCDGHLGHVFPDGPEPTGLRYCINGVALTYEPDDAAHADD